MQLELERDELQKTLELVGRVSTKHVTLPVLQCVLFVVEKDAVVLKATNLEIGIEALIKGVKNNESSTIAVPAQTLLHQLIILAS